MTIPAATYRVQFHPGFTFADAATVADYLARLGVSHLYASPYLQAAPGSTHGYDVVDPTKVNKELGGRVGHRKLCQTLTDLNLGQVLDIVPNHMAISGPENEWWWDVLENGPASQYATYFDVDWNPFETWLGNKIFLPILGDRYGRVLEAGQIALFHEKGRFTIHYYEHRFPVAPQSLGGLLSRAAQTCESKDLAFAADLLSHLPVLNISEHEHKQRRHRNMEVIRTQLGRLMEENGQIRAAVDREVEAINHDPDRLDRLLESQNYQLAYWRAASQEMGYRRFFDINTLVGLRVEDETVFFDTHRLIQEWLEAGTLAGVRVDHPDGLRDPQRYLERLRSLKPDAWIIAEKILQPGERLPETWPVEGTTGYDFMYLVGQLLVDSSGEKVLTDFYQAFTGRSADYRHVVREKKHQVMQDTLGGDVNHLTELLLDICRGHRHYRDYTRMEVGDALQELIASFPVYRSYVMPWHEEVRPEDKQTIQTAVVRAKERLAEDTGELLDFIRSILLLEYMGERETEFVLRFQQLTGPVTAKGVEDTAFYCFNRFLALNEVGGNPGNFGISVNEFHHAMAEKASLHPHTMLATSTHDTKRSEDVRARLSLLSEMPRQWVETVRRWSRHNETYRVDGKPDRNMEYLLYQTLVGAWPIETDRLSGFAEKAAREAKEYTAWSHIDADYEESLQRFIQEILSDTWFRSDLKKFVTPLIRPGRINALAQILIKLTAPGIPDIYQGSELWDMSLVDPDNRRPVDFDHRRKLLAELEGLSPNDMSKRSDDMLKRSDDILRRMDEGLPKLWVIHQALALRKRLPAVFNSGDYHPLSPKGKMASHAIAFARGSEVVTIVPRLVWHARGRWDNTSIRLPAGNWYHELTGQEVSGNTVQFDELFNRFPVALLSREGPK